MTVTAEMVREAVARETGMDVPESARVEAYDSDAYDYFEIGAETVRVVWTETECS